MNSNKIYNIYIYYYLSKYNLKHINLLIIFILIIINNLTKFTTNMGIGDWGLGIGDWGLGLGPIPNPQSPIPIPI